MSDFFPTWPMCGINSCVKPSAYVDSVGVGYCSEDCAGMGALRRVYPGNYTAFDPWWAYSMAAYAQKLDWPDEYGEWPPDVKPPPGAFPGWGLPEFVQPTAESSQEST